MNPRTISTLLVLVIQALTGPAWAQKGDVHDPYRILSEDGTAKIPFTLARNHILLKVEIKGKEMLLALDNGVLWDEVLLYGSPKVAALGLQGTGKATIGTPGTENAVAVDAGAVATVRLPGMELIDQSVIITPADSRFSKVFEEDGIISGSLFKHFVVSIDFDNLIITLTKPDAFTYAGAGTELAMKPLGRGSYTLPCTLHLENGKSVSLNPAIDLGGTQPLLVYLCARKDISVPSKATPAVLGILQGPDKGFLGRIERVDLGGYSLKNVLTGFTNTPGILGPSVDGLLGLPLLSRFHVTFDYRNTRVFLEPNNRFHDPF